MKIMVIGTRGIPKLQGGVEKHCEELYTRLAKSEDLQITIICRPSYLPNKLKSFKKVALKYFYVPQIKSIEAILQSIISVLYAGFKRPDILHIHAVGPNLITPFARLLGLKVVMTHHGYDYDRQKWGKIAKFILKLGERMGVKYANKVIVISTDIKKHIENKYKRYDSVLIPNGFNVIPKDDGSSFLRKYNLINSKYIFGLGRLVPEKGFEYLFKAYKNSGINKQIKLVIAGEADHESEYSKNLKKIAAKEGIIMTGFINGNELSEIFSNAGLFVLPSFHEGLSISILEAMAYNLTILTSDIPSNRQFELPDECYFEVGSIEDLATKMKNWQLSNRNNLNLQYDLRKYDWDQIAEATSKVYFSCGTIKKYSFKKLEKFST